MSAAIGHGSEGRPVVLITGAGTGIGAAAAERFAREGADVVVTGRRLEPLQVVAARVGGVAVAVDVADSVQANDLVQRVLDRFGRLDVLVANAGGHSLGRVGDMTDEDWAQDLRANVSTAFMIARAALPALIESRGSVVVVSSLAGLFAGPSVAGYTIGKHALIGLTRSLARDYGRFGVRVNAICPGWVRTPMADVEMDDFARAAGIGDREAAYGCVVTNVPLGRVGEAEEIAGTIRFLASDDASYITGAVLVVDGGAHVVDVPTTALDLP
ncbi:SDR family NAD(P)-dependent oxidoreductase [uncultured Amnibacterium sp.]|uniref:SDR family NAD(P)-dependent oxidoreductase n=1 Tax=uncultured Amnibacterium sp. TaxID=1631851 RepID=UPI0035CB34C4